MSKNIFVKTLLVGLLLGILAVGSAFCDNLLDEAKKLSWDTQNFEVLKSLFYDKASVQAFFYQLNADIALTKMTVGEYEITDLNNDGNLELLATFDSSGRGFYNTLYVVHKVNGGFQTFKMGGYPDIELKTSIVDLNHDGVKEILVPRLLAYPQFGTDPRPIINDVYEWDGAGYSKANVYFKDYYRSLLPRLWSELEAVRQGQKLDVPEHKDLLEKKYEREIEEVNKILSE